MTPLLDASYVLPLRWTRPQPIDELTRYLTWLTTQLDEVVVVDGSPAEIFDAHHARWAPSITHIKPDPAHRCLNGKVQGVHTGIGRAAHDRVVVADDDVRYDEAALRRVVGRLERDDLVWPQNYFDPAPWHARWDTARTLLNRVTGGDFPGTAAIRRSTFERAGGYDGDVLWENLELLRTVDAAGGTIAVMPDCYVRRLPPTASHFRSQRVRQAYDEFARPARLAITLAVLPASLLALRRNPRALVAAIGTTVALGRGRTPARRRTRGLRGVRISARAGVGSRTGGLRMARSRAARPSRRGRICRPRPPARRDAAPRPPPATGARPRRDALSFRRETRGFSARAREGPGTGRAPRGWRAPRRS